MASEEQPSKDGNLILKSVYPDIDFSTVDNQTITEILWAQLPKWKNEIALECGITGKKYTYNDCYNLSRSFATSLIKCGVQKRDICGILGPNCQDLILAILGAWDAGCIADVINPNFTKEELIARLNKLKTKHFVVHATLLPLFHEVMESGFHFDNVIVIDDDESPYRRFKDMCAEKPDDKDFLRGRDVDTKTYVAVLGNTSGTTAASKIVALTHRNYISAIRQFTTEDIMDFPSFENGRKQPAIIGMLPVFHTYGLFITTVFSMHQGAKIVVIPKYEPELYVKLLNLHKPTVLHLISPLVEFLTNNPEVTVDAFENCKSVFVAFRNFSVTDSLVTAFQAKAKKPIVFQEGWGCTEALVATIRNPSFKNGKLGSVGRVIPSVLVKVVDIDSGKLLGPYEKGHICIKGPQVSLGYFGDPVKTKELFDDQGFLQSGDYGYYDEDQCFYIVERLVDLIKVGGHWVSPTRLEAVLRKHPDVLDIVIIGVSDGKGAEVPQAHIIRRDGSNVTEEEIKEFLKGQVPEDYKQLAGGVVFTDTIPRGPTGKTLRRELRSKKI